MLGYRHGGRFFVTFAVLAATAAFVATEAAQAAAPIRSLVERQRLTSPGHGYEWAVVGPCAGSWRDVKTGVCNHADFADSSEGGEVDEPAPPDAGGPAYCAGPPNIRGLYVTTTSRENRASLLIDDLRQRLKNADYYLNLSAAHRNATRHFRFICNSSSAIAFESPVLADSAATSFNATVDALRARGYNRDDKKYIAFVDWKEGGFRDNVCGRADIRGDDQPGQENRNNSGNIHAVVYLRATSCSYSWGITAFHELAHLLGAVQDTAPNHDFHNYWHARDEYDVMAYGSNVYPELRCTDPKMNNRYDCGKEDYFNPNPAPGTYLYNHWNIGRNKFLVGGG